MLCDQCLYPNAAGASSLHDFPKVWRRPVEFAPWVPEGPRVYFRKCETCGAAWGVVRQGLSLEPRELTRACADLLEENTSLDHDLNLFAVEAEDRLLETCISQLVRARTSEGDSVGAVHCILNWLKGDTSSASGVSRIVDLLGGALSAACFDSEVSERERRMMADAFVSRIDEGQGFEDAARLANEDTARNQTVMSLPRLRRVDVRPLMRLYRDPPPSDTEYGTEQLKDGLARTLTLIARYSRRPRKLTLTPESSSLVTEFL